MRAGAWPWKKKGASPNEMEPMFALPLPFEPFVELFTAEEGRLGVVVTFMAILERVKESLVELVQNEPFAAIHVRARAE